MRKRRPPKEPEPHHVRPRRPPARATLNPTWNKDLTFDAGEHHPPRATLFVFSKNDYVCDTLLGKCVAAFERPRATAPGGGAAARTLLAKTWLAIVPCEERERETIEHFASEYGLNLRPNRFLFKKGSLGSIEISAHAFEVHEESAVSP